MHYRITKIHHQKDKRNELIQILDSKEKSLNTFDGLDSVRMVAVDETTTIAISKYETEHQLQEVESRFQEIMADIRHLMTNPPEVYNGDVFWQFDPHSKLPLCTFEDIMTIFPKESLHAIINTINLKDLSVAIIGLENDKKNKIKDLLPRTKQLMLDDGFSTDTHSDDQIKDARELFIEAANFLHQDGFLNLYDLLKK